MIFFDSTINSKEQNGVWDFTYVYNWHAQRKWKDDVAYVKNKYL